MLLSVVIPCLNESDTIATCVDKARSTVAEIDGETEVIVADNGSVDDSQALALAAGARIVSVPEKGYGNALMGGIDAAKGHYVILVDADDSYDFGQIPLFLEKLRAGSELVLGCRLPSGGGRIFPGAMPWLHRWLGNPMFSFLARSWFHAPIHDVNCGMRGLSKDLYRRLEQRCTGMAFATEMVIKACLVGAKIAELPVTLKPDGRKNHPPHLRTFHDGWDTLRVFLLFNPRARFLSKVPGLRCNGHPSRGTKLKDPPTAHEEAAEQCERQ